MQSEALPPGKALDPSAPADKLVVAEGLDHEEYSKFRPGAKYLVVALASAAGFMSPLGATVYMPALPTISRDLHISDAETLISMTMYLIFQGVAPSFWAPLSDSIGRRPVYIATFVVFLVANLGLSYVKVYWGLLLLRMLQACGASSAIAIGAGQVSDVARRKERGNYMGHVQMGTLVGPAVGPVFGGLLSHRWGWHSIFFFLVAMTSVMLLCLILFLPETLRSLVGDGSKRPVGVWRAVLSGSLTRKDASAPTERMNMPDFRLKQLGLAQSWLNFRRLNVVLLILCYSCAYTIFSVASSTMSPTLADHYGYGPIVIGLCYLPLGFGFMLGSFIGGRVVDIEYARARRMYGDDLNIYQARLRLAPVFLSIFFLLMLIFEWLLEYSVHIAGPMVVVFFATMAAMMSFTPINTLLVDLNSTRAASVVASLNIFRCVLAAIVTAFTQYGIDAIGVGWMYTIYILVFLAICLPLLLLIPRYAHAWFKDRS